MKALGVLVAIALSLALQTTMSRFIVGGSVAVDVVLVAVIATALTIGPVGGMLAGTAAGLIQDALSSGVIGIGGLAKTIVGFLAGAFGQQFIVTAALPRLVIFVAGTGNPFFSTDTTAALRANEIGADVILKATKVDGVYDKDPVKFADAVRYEHLTYSEALAKRLQVMDSTAFSLCMDNHVPIIVFDLMTRNNIRKVVLGQKVGTLVSD